MTPRFSWSNVGKSDAFLKLDILDGARGIIESGGDFRGLAVSSFPSLDSAARLVNSTLAQNQETVDLVASGQAANATLRAEFGSPTGYEAYLTGPNSLPYMRDVYGVTVYIVPDARSSRGYRVQSAYPSNY
jgi:hypothetical protein